jgi:hypothetical protein
MDKIAAITPQQMRTLLRLAKHFEQSGFEMTAGQKTPLIGDAPRIYKAIVTEEITAFDGTDVGTGKATVKYVPGEIGTDNELLDYPDAINPAEKIVHNDTATTFAVGQYVALIREFAGGRWFVISGGGSRRANAVLDADMLPTDDFVSVVSIEPIEGAGDTEPIDAANVCRWYGITGNKCKIEYNPNFDNGLDPETSEPLPPGGWELYAIEINYTLECPVIEVEE